MRILNCIITVIFIGLACNLNGQSIDLSVSGYEQIIFKGIKPTEYRNENSMLVANVKASSSILMRSFDNIMDIAAVSVEWQSSGDLNIQNHMHQTTKKGDDARFRIGLILSGKAPFLPIFAPTWIKKTSSILKYPSDKMIYLTLGAKEGERWHSPYSGSIESIALSSKALEDGWFRSEIGFDSKLKVVGLWLFADGDDTKSSFITKIRKLKLHQTDR